MVELQELRLRHARPQLEVCLGIDHLLYRDFRAGFEGMKQDISAVAMQSTTFIHDAPFGANAV
jgi:hypothetical protein